MYNIYCLDLTNDLLFGGRSGEYWGEPKNKNKLEKTTIAHDPKLGEAVEKAGEGVEGFVKEVKILQLY